MNAKEYLNNLLGEQTEAEKAPETPAAAPAGDPDIAAALAAQAETFKEELAARDERLAKIEDATAPIDPDKHIVINGQNVALPDTEEDWQRWIQSARATVANDETGEMQASYEDFMGRYYKWAGAKSAERRFDELKATLPAETPETEEAAADTAMATTLDQLGLTEGTKGRIAVETLVGAGKTLEEALTLIDVDASNVRVSPTGADRVAAMERAQAFPDRQTGMEPPKEVIDRHRGATDKSQVSKNMNASLASVAARRRSAARIFKRA